MFALSLTSVDHISSAAITRQRTRKLDELVALAEEKGASFWKALGMMDQGMLFALTGKASRRCPIITSDLAALRSTGATFWMPLWLFISGESLCGTRPIR